MKRKILLKTMVAIGFVLTMLSSKNADACIPPDSIVWLKVRYDTANTLPCPTLKQVEIRLSNLRLMTESPNKLCNCGLTSLSNLFANLKYVAFVDSGTNNPYQGFQAWNNNGMAASAWNAANPRSNGWQSFIANTINSGLSANDPVEMVIRAELPPNVTLYTDTACVATHGLDDMLKDSTELGTDEWDATTNDLKASHQGIRSFDYTKHAASKIAYELKDHAYFTQLDNDILNNIPSGILILNSVDEGINVYPNPVERNIQLNYKLDKTEQVTIELYSILGEKVSELYNGVSTQGNNSQLIELNKNLVKPGIYLVVMKTSDRNYSKRIVVSQ